MVAYLGCGHGGSTSSQGRETAARALQRYSRGLQRLTIGANSSHQAMHLISMEE